MRTLKVFFTLALFIPLAFLVWQLVHGQLGAQPAEEMNHQLGELTYRYLAANLIWGGVIALRFMPRRLLRYSLLRRHLGVTTFVYALLHVTFYFLKEGDLALAAKQMFTKLYLIIGFMTLLILAALTVTSTDWAVRKMRRNWKRLHRLAYLALALATVHFYLIEKKDWRVTLPFLIPVVLLGFWRFYRYALYVRTHASEKLT